MSYFNVEVPKSFAELEKLQKHFMGHKMFKIMTEENIPKVYLKSMACGLIHHNIAVVKGFGLMRYQCLSRPHIITNYLDKLLATELGADLSEVGLKQDGISHITMLIDLAHSLGMEVNDYVENQSNGYAMMNHEFIEMFNTKSIAFGLGALFGDEVFTEVSLRMQYSAYKKYAEIHNEALNLIFFEKHINEIEPCHVKYTFRLVELCQEENLPQDEFSQGFNKFMLSQQKQWEIDLNDLRRLGVSIPEMSASAGV